jgi:UDP-N-acetyl-2-amino-2-deoxyglucuronate dehydrogenase
VSRVLPVILDRKIRFAVVGCGRISANHFEALEKHREHAELVAVCDTNPEALKAATSKRDVPGYSSLEDLLAKSNADVAILCTPSGLHSFQAIQAAAAGKHVVCEKPMATHFEDGLRMVEACSKAGVRLFVVKQNRRNPTLQLLKSAVEQNRFGKIYLVNINVFWTRPQSYYEQAKWRGTWALDGGAFMNQASHYVDLLDWLIGPIETVHSFTATLARKIEAEDTGVATFRWRSGALGSMNVTMLTYPNNLEGSITILGERGTVRIGGVAVNEIQQWEFSEKKSEDDQVKTASYETTSVYGHGHPLYYENVIKTFRGLSEPETDGREGLRSLEVLAAIYRSAQEARDVKLPLEIR